MVNVYDNKMATKPTVTIHFELITYWFYKYLTTGQVPVIDRMRILANMTDNI